MSAPNSPGLIDGAFAPAFTAWGAPFTWLELLAFVLSVLMVLANQRQRIVGWPLAIVASALYFALFLRGKLYGEAALQLFFVALAIWGWWQWWRGVDGHALPVRRLNPQGWWLCAASVLVGGPLLGWLLSRYTDSPLPYWDALPTIGSVVATVLLGRKFIENWPLWIVVNLASVALFTQRGYWLTVLLYAALIPLAAQGWRAWAVVRR